MTIATPRQIRSSNRAARKMAAVAGAVGLGLLAALSGGALAAPEKPAKKAAAKGAVSASPVSRSDQAIIALVNDEPITGYEVEQRQRILALSSNIGERAQANFKALLSQPGTNERLKGILNEVIQANRTKTKEQIIAIFEERKKAYAMSLQKQAVDSARSSVLPTLRKGALEELIEERLKMQEAKRLSVIAADDDVERIIKGIAERNKQTPEQFAQNLKNMGADITSMKARFKATLSWNDVIRRKFGHMVAISERDVDRYVATSGGTASGDQVELQVQRILLPIPGKLDQKAMAGHLAQAEAVRGKFSGCKSTPTAAASVNGAKFEDLGVRKPDAFQEPTRSLLLAAKDGEMLPATVGKGGVELWVVCSRTVLKADEAKRTEAQDQLRQKELEMLAKRHLKDLRQDASIEFR